MISNKAFTYAQHSHDKYLYGSDALAGIEEAVFRQSHHDASAASLSEAAMLALRQ